MAAWGSLTQEQRDVYSVFERDLRGICAELQKLCSKMVALDARYAAQIQGILVALDDNSVVPNSSGLAGSSSLSSDSEMATLVSHMQGILTNYNTSGHQQMRAKAVGSANMAN